MYNNLTSQIKRYVQDQSAHYAIALEGDWGSGKTRYCETELTNKLYAQGYDVLRVSLFGITSPEEVYRRLAMSMTRLASDEDDSRAQRFIKSLVTIAAQSAISYGTQKLSEVGVSLEASPQILTGVLGAKQLIVFDDVERCGTDAGLRQGLFGLINNLIEAQGCKVMLVTNQYDSVPADIREKVIWKCYRFEPNPEDLVKDIVLPRVLDAQQMLDIDFDISRTLIMAAKGSRCFNARAMIKSTELLIGAITCETLSDRQIDAENRECALRDFARFAFLAAMNEAPDGQLSEGDDDNALVERIHERIEYNTYQQLWVIRSFFDSKTSIKEGDVDACLRSYIESTYSGTPETMALKHILDRSTSVSTMEDAEVADLASQLSSCITGTVFDLGLLNRAVQLNMTLRDWGFEEALPDESLLVRAKELADRNVEEAYRKIHGEYAAWRDEWQERYSVLVNLDKYIVNRYQGLRANRLEDAIRPEDPNAGCIFADIIRGDLARGGSLYLGYDPEFIANLFVNGNAGSQHALYELVAGFNHYATFYTNEQALAWSNGLHNELLKIGPQSKMGRKRLSWTIDSLKKLLEMFGPV